MFFKTFLAVPSFSYEAFLYLIILITYKLYLAIIDLALSHDLDKRNLKLKTLLEPLDDVIILKNLYCYYFHSRYIWICPRMYPETITINISCMLIIYDKNIQSTDKQVTVKADGPLDIWRTSLTKIILLGIPIGIYE